MSIILEGIDLPKGDTAEVIIRIQPNGEVRDSHGILLNVKAVQIPKGHGRLIDAGEMQDKAYERYFNNTISSYGMFEVNRAIDNAPTILEAEE